jgi:HPt (histidine-containing phosphotransfer) domain-containing protein
MLASFLPAANHAIDRDILRTLEETVAAGLPGLMVELLDSYLEDSPKQLENLRQAVDNQDAQRVQFGAHTLKSGSATFGAMRLANLCQELEEQAKMSQAKMSQAKMSQASVFQPLTQAIHGEFERVRDALQFERRSRVV